MNKTFAIIAAALVSAGAYANENLAAKIPATDPVKQISLSPTDHRQWQKLSFNSRNLLYSSTAITLNNQVVGPILRYPLTGENPKLIVIDLVYSGTDENCPVAQQQTLVTLNGPDGKGMLWGFRFGRNNLRFLDEKAVNFPLPDDGKVKVRIIVDTVSKIAEVYIGDADTPVLRHGAFNLNKPASVPSISIGDGSVAVKGVCELYQLDVRLY